MYFLFVESMMQMLMRTDIYLTKIISFQFQPIDNQGIELPFDLQMMEEVEVVVAVKG
jgi:hypothetical protein